MMSVLAVSGSEGTPLAPIEVHLKTADGILSTRQLASPDIHTVPTPAWKIVV